ncbi:MAG: hypothetical protein A2007_04070 [Verrucomicrobia bacterium GWC2_42_7]|nr:MAG: hypothetical protein A2007_04070 [Verrucomicrobia bacterium GWC2_42_7]
MEQRIDRENMTTLYGLIVFIWASGCFFHYLIKGSRQKVQCVTPWSISWLNFGIFMWAVLFLMLMVPNVAVWILAKLGMNFNFYGWNEVVGGFATQLILCSFFIYLVVNKEDFYKRLGLFSQEKTWTLFRQAFYQLGVTLPLVWVSLLMWFGIMSFWSRIGYPVEQSPQLLIKLMGEIHGVTFKVIVFIFAVVIAPITEELLFRGGIYRFLKGKINPLFALILSSLLFSCGHFSLTTFLPLFLLGMALGRIYEQTGDLRISIFMHALFNFNTIFLLILNPELSKVMQSNLG